MKIGTIGKYSNFMKTISKATKANLTKAKLNIPKLKQ